jgi:ABC-type bacteriocin/lantibiotic exporter with double-glycine peptidase domain
MYQQGQGSTHQGMSSCLRHFGLNTQLTYTHNISALRSAISRGHPVIINLRGNYGPFYTAGHITVVVGFTANGSAIINDSAGGVRRTIPASVLARTWNGLFIEVSK